MLDAVFPVTDGAMLRMGKWTGRIGGAVAWTRLQPPTRTRFVQARFSISTLACLEFGVQFEDLELDLLDFFQNVDLAAVDQVTQSQHSPG